jgi:transcriptional regulatory protein GAL4
LDNQLTEEWDLRLPVFFAKNVLVPHEYRLSHAIMTWKYRNLKIIMYRPFVMRQAMYARQGYRDNSPEGTQAYDQCLHEAGDTIMSIEEFWAHQEHTRIAAWYAL